MDQDHTKWRARDSEESSYITMNDKISHHYFSRLPHRIHGMRLTKANIAKSSRNAMADVKLNCYISGVTEIKEMTSSTGRRLHSLRTVRLITPKPCYPLRGASSHVGNAISMHNTNIRLIQPPALKSIICGYASHWSKYSQPPAQTGPPSSQRSKTGHFPHGTVVSPLFRDSQKSSSPGLEYREGFCLEMRTAR